MERLKKARAVQRSAFTKTANYLTTLLAEQHPDDAATQEIRATVQVLQQKHEGLRDADLKLYDMMLESDASEEDIIRETTSADEYIACFARLTVRYEDIVADHASMFTAENRQRRDADGSQGQGQTSQTRKFKLPKIELRKFGGEVKDWLTFWSQFEKIHVDEEIESGDKFQYLLQATIPGSRARELVESFPPTAANYAKVIESLKARFGRDELQVEVYVRELLKLVLSKSFLHQDMQLVSLYDKIETQLRALDSLGVTTEKCAAMLFPLVESCLPEELIRVWQRSTYFSQNVNSVSKSRLDGLMAFLKNEVENEERVRMASEGFGKTPRETKKKENSKTCIPTAAGLVNTQLSKCIFCDGAHENESCFKAQKMNNQEKHHVLQSKGACFVCLRLGHVSRKCKAQVRCQFCGKRHLILLCPEMPKYQKSVPDEKGEENKTSKESSRKTEQTLANKTHSHVFLQTLRVKIRSESREREVRALIDTGSQRSYVLTSTAADMEYSIKRKEKMIHALFGGSHSPEVDHACYDLRLSSLDGKYACHFEAFGQANICDNISAIYDGGWSAELKKLGVRLTDIKDSAKIEVLIGADVAGKLLTGRRHILKCGVVAVETMLGWTLMGKSPDDTPRRSSTMTVTSLFAREMDISELWRLDVLGISDPGSRRSAEEMEAAVNRHFLETVKIDEGGRYQVRLPWLEGHPPLPTNFNIAKKRLDSVVKKLKTEGIYEDYQEVFAQWQSEGVIERVPEDELEHSAHYLPHRPVIKESSSTTKIRPVFDASAHDRNHPSLNVCLEKGPNLIELIPAIINRFRIARIGVVSDIKKAFLQISLHESERDWMRFLWYGSNNELQVYRHRRVVFGVCCSPYLLAMTINCHLKRMLDGSYPSSTIDKLLASFYVDNCVTSVASEEELNTFVREASQLMSEGQFDLRGWEFSDINGNPEENRCPTNVLGMDWDKTTDTLAISQACFLADEEPVTKRRILSAAQRLFDPIGFTAPVTVTPKLLLQKMWQAGTGWDDEMYGEIRDMFLKWKSELPLLSELKIPRWLNYDVDEVTSISIHTFCDASQDAYATAIYLRVASPKAVRVQLIQAKARVSPLQRLTIPRLELLAAVIGARLYSGIKDIFAAMNFESYFWTDSSTVLSWIRGEDEWAVFVWNRVLEIRSLTPKEQWRHVPGHLNPADLPSRGCSAGHLVDSRWWEGPSWLYESPETWPIVKPDEEQYNEAEINQERKKRLVSSLVSAAGDEWNWTHFSKYDKTIRMFAWILRFTHNARKPRRERTQRRRGPLVAEEMDAAEVFVFGLIQRETFSGVADKRLSTLNAFCDKLGLIRLKSRVSNREDDEHFRFPVVLPSGHPVIELLIREVHEQMCHVGTQGLMSALREKYWIVGGRRAVRSVISKCVVCKRHSAKSMTEECPPLPADRVRDASVFEVVGVDFAGPVFLKNGQKAWVCLFTCAVYRAVHLELTTSLSTVSFLQAFRRFVARRGRPKTVYSDNGTNFVGADNAFGRLDWEQIVRDASARRISWRFNPPTAAWWGGWWERLIGLLKQLLKRVLGRASLSYEDFSTVLCDAEAVVNSRPITYISDDPGDLAPLTPAMFLQDCQEFGVPDCDVIEATAFSRRLQHRQKLRQDLRQRFRNEYLGQLRQVFSKKSGRDVVLGEIVLVGSDNKKRLDWPLGRVVDLLPGQDGKVRLVRVKTAQGCMLRPVQRLFPLECVLAPVTTGGSASSQASTSDAPEAKKNEVLENAGVQSRDAGQRAKVTWSTEECDVSFESGVQSRDSGQRARVTRRGREVKLPRKFVD